MLVDGDGGGYDDDDADDDEEKGSRGGGGARRNGVGARTNCSIAAVKSSSSLLNTSCARQVRSEQQGREKK